MEPVAARCMYTDEGVVYGEKKKTDAGVIKTDARSHRLMKQISALTLDTQMYKLNRCVPVEDETGWEPADDLLSVCSDPTAAPGLSWERSLPFSAIRTNEQTYQSGGPNVGNKTTNKPKVASSGKRTKQSFTAVLKQYLLGKKMPVNRKLAKAPKEDDSDNQDNTSLTKASTVDVSYIFGSTASTRTPRHQHVSRPHSDIERKERSRSLPPSARRQQEPKEVPAAHKVAAGNVATPNFPAKIVVRKRRILVRKKNGVVVSKTEIPANYDRKTADHKEKIATPRTTNTAPQKAPAHINDTLKTKETFNVKESSPSASDFGVKYDYDVDSIIDSVTRRKQEEPPPTRRHSVADSPVQELRRRFMKGGPPPTKKILLKSSRQKGHNSSQQQQQQRRSNMHTREGARVRASSQHARSTSVPRQRRSSSVETSTNYGSKGTHGASRQRYII